MVLVSVSMSVVVFGMRLEVLVKRVYRRKEMKEERKSTGNPRLRSLFDGLGVGGSVVHMEKGMLDGEKESSKEILGLFGFGRGYRNYGSWICSLKECQILYCINE